MLVRIIAICFYIALPLGWASADNLQPLEPTRLNSSPAPWAQQLAQGGDCNRMDRCPTGSKCCYVDSSRGFCCPNDKACNIDSFSCD